MSLATNVFTVAVFCGTQYIIYTFIWKKNSIDSSNIQVFVVANLKKFAIFVK